MGFTTQLQNLKKGMALSRDDANKLLSCVLDDDTITDKQITELLTILSQRTLAPDEISGFIDAMRARMVKIQPTKGAIDTCGTGGDKSGTFNISTATAILVGAAGVPVAKHGNKAATSQCGSADVLEALHIPVDLSVNDAQTYLQKNSFVFLFAPLYHPSLRRLAIIRKQLGFPTVFNILGPLLNPALVKRQVIGTFSKKNAELIAEVAAKMNFEHVVVLSSQDGMDEASLSAPVDIFDVRGGTVTHSVINGSDFGLFAVKKADLLGGDAKKNAEIIQNLMRAGDPLSPQQNIVIFNAAIALYVAGMANDIASGIEIAKQTLQSGDGGLFLKRLSGLNN